MPRKKRAATAEPDFYRHPESESVLRPDVGTQAQFRKKKPPEEYKYDSSLSPELQWDGQNAAREEGEQKISAAIEHLAQLRRKISEADLEDPVAENLGLSRQALLKLLGGSLDEAQEALRELKAISGPFLNWAGKADRPSFEVPTLPLFVHERLSTKAIL